jgi:PAS domain S-box-containing protein
VVQPDGTLRQLSSGHTDPATDAMLLELRERHRRQRAPADRIGAARAVLTGEPAIYPPIPADALPFASTAEMRLWEQLSPVSFLVVPLEADGRPLGALTFLSTEPDRVYTEGDFPVALELAERCAQALRNAQAYAAAESSRALLDALIETAPVGMAFVDADLRYVLINRHLAELDLRTVEEHLGRRMDEVLGAAGDEATRLVREVLATGVAVRDREIVGADGRAFLGSYAPVTGEHGALGVVCAVVETTERHRAARAVAESEARFRALAQSGIIGVYHGRGTAVVEANDAFLDMLGLTRAELLAGEISWPDVTPERWHELDAAKYEELLSTGSFAPFEKEYVHRDGRCVPVLIGASALRAGDDEWICFVVDLTERKRAERERERLLDRTARLQSVTEQLSAALTKDEVAAVIVQAGMEATGASCGVLGLRHEDRALRVEHRFGMAGAAPSELPLDAEAPMPAAARAAAPVLLQSRDEWLERFPAVPPRTDFEAFAAVPMAFEGAVHGCMGLGFPQAGPFDGADVDLLVAIARQGAQALERARLYEERAYVARTLQAGLLPRALPVIPGLDVAVRYRPVGDGSEVGGDFYDLFATADDEWMLAIGDVCGKGTQAAVLTGVVRSTIRALALAPPADPSRRAPRRQPGAAARDRDARPGDRGLRARPARGRRLRGLPDRRRAPAAARPARRGRGRGRRRPGADARGRRRARPVDGRADARPRRHDRALHRRRPRRARQPRDVRRAAPARRGRGLRRRGAGRRPAARRRGRPPVRARPAARRQGAHGPRRPAPLGPRPSIFRTILVGVAGTLAAGLIAQAALGRDGGSQAR